MSVTKDKQLRESDASQMLQFIDKCVTDISITRDLTAGQTVTVTWDTYNGCTAERKGRTIREALAKAIRANRDNTVYPAAKPVQEIRLTEADEEEIDRLAQSMIEQGGIPQFCYEDARVLVLSEKEHQLKR